MKRPKSIFRYPGGKLKAIKYIKPFWEAAKHSEYREPFVGGGSVFISKPLAQFNWINDIDTDMTSFYTVISNQKSREKLISELKKIEINKKNYDYFFNLKTKNQIEKAKRIYILNRCSFSGITVWNSFIGDVRYNIDNAQHTIRDVGEKLEKTKITSLDFEEIMLQSIC